MTNSSPLYACAAALILLTLGACSGDNSAAIAATDGALKGSGEGAVFAPVAVRPVRVGMAQDRRADACTRRVTPVRDGIDVHWGPAANPHRRATLSDAALACDADGAWTGIVFAAAGQSLSDCNLSRRIAGPTDYQGPCRSGWVRTAELRAGG